MHRSQNHSLAASVIVPVFNGADTLGACLDALATQSADPDSYEVIVVDDGSTDGSAEVAERHNVAIIQQDHTGPAAARNKGAAEAQGGALLFTDADCEPADDWIEQMLAPLADRCVAGVKGVYRTRQRSLLARFAQAEFEEKYGRQRRMRQIDFVDTYAAAYRRDLFLAHGGFDAGFLGDEDQEFSFRLAEAGHKLVFAPSAVVYHRHPTSLWRYARRRAHNGHWKVRVLVRHPSKAVYDSYTPWTQKAQIALLPLVGAATAGAVLGLAPWTAVAVFALLGLISTIPLTVKAAEQGWQVAASSPFLVLVRTLALLLGMAWGVIGLRG
jgi:GT2 family glycosyltransferase